MHFGIFAAHQSLSTPAVFSFFLISDETFLHVLFKNAMLKLDDVMSSVY